MKKESFRYRTMCSFNSFSRPIEDPRSNVFDSPSASAEPGVRAKKIFVIRQMQRLPAATAAAKKIERILIFDNHPESLRLLLGQPVNQHLHNPEKDCDSLWDLVLPGMAILTALVALFWPLF